MCMFARDDESIMGDIGRQIGERRVKRKSVERLRKDISANRTLNLKVQIERT